MKINTASIRCVNRVGQQVVQVDHQAAQHQAETYRETLPIKCGGGGPRDQKMQYQM